MVICHHWHTHRLFWAAATRPCEQGDALLKVTAAACLPWSWGCASASCKTGIGIRAPCWTGICKMKWGDTGIASFSCSSQNLDRNFFPISSKRVFSLKDTHKSYPYNNCIFCYSKHHEISERHKGFGQGRVGWGENIKVLKKW